MEAKHRIDWRAVTVPLASHHLDHLLFGILRALLGIAGDLRNRKINPGRV